jgi:hypothetical protein
MAVKPKESTRNTTLNDSCHTIPRSHRLTGYWGRGGIVHWRSTGAWRDVPGTVRTLDMEEAVLDTTEEKPSSSTRTTARDLRTMTLTFCCISYRAVTHKGSVSEHMFT